MAPGLGSGGVIGLEEGLADRGGNDGVLAFGHMRQGVPHEVDAAALPGRAEDAHASSIAEIAQAATIQDLQREGAGTIFLLPICMGAVHSVQRRRMRKAECLG